MNEWVDRRSGALGRLAGNIVLRHLEKEGRPIRREKGTIFANPQHLLVGRTAKRTYLHARERHWFNLSMREHRAASEAARRNGLALHYLLIATTLGRRPSIDYWLVAGEFVGRILHELGRRGAEQAALRITEDDGRHILNGVDVTDVHQAVPLSRRERALLRGADEGADEATECAAPTATRALAPAQDAPDDQAMIFQAALGRQRWVGVARLAEEP
jgi:hypothetical protein